MSTILASGPTHIGVEVKSKCKVIECKHTAKKSGFCGWCFRKFEKGIYADDGTLTYDASQKKIAQVRRAAKREEKEKLRIWTLRKEEIKSRLTVAHLKVLQVEHPEIRVGFHCRALSICMEEAACYNRIYLQNRYKECTRCHIHDDKMDFLEEFLSKQEDKIGKE
jgi:hypothetical protein